MNKFKGLMTSLSPHYATPKWLYDELDKEFHFDFDPCPLNASFDGLTQEWGYCNFINPPYGRKIGLWIERAWQDLAFNKMSVMLLPARTDTRWFHKWILPYAREIRFIKGRLKFGDSKNSAPFPSMIVVFDK